MSILIKQWLDMYTSSLGCSKASDCLSCNEHKYVEPSFDLETYGCTSRYSWISNCESY